MKTPTQQETNGNVLLCALCTIIVVSLIGANVLINCTRQYNVTAKQLKGWKEALYAAEAGADAGFDEVRKLVGPSPAPTPSSTDGWSAAPSPAPTPGPAWTKTISNFGQANSLSTIVTIDRLFDSTDTIPNTVPYYRIRAVGYAKVFGLPRTGLSDQYFAGGPNFVAKSATRGIGDTLLRKIDFKFDHFKATYGDGDGHGVSLSTVGNPQVARRVELVAVPKFYTFAGAMRLVRSFDGPGSSGIIDSYSSVNPNDPNPPSVGGTSVPANTSSYWGPNPNDTTDPTKNSKLLSDARDGDVSVGTGDFTEPGWIWGDVTTNGGNVTHALPYHISGTIDNNVPFSVKDQWAPDTTGYTVSSATTLNPVGQNQYDPEGYVYSGLSGNLTITNGKAGTNYPYVFVRIVVNGDITAGTKITVAKGVTAQIFFTGNMKVKGSDLVNLNTDLGHQPQPYKPGILGVTPDTPADDPIVSAAGHLQFYGINPPATSPPTTQTIEIDPPGNVFATFYAPGADILLKGNPDIFGAVVARGFDGNGGGGGNTGFHYDKWLNGLSLGVVDDYQIASYVEDVR